MQTQQHTNSRETALAAARKMPLIDHFRRGEPFDIMRSKVCEWLCQQPEIRQDLFNHFRRSGAIVYVDGQWRGADSAD
jgi:hypothetical protein